MSLPFIFVIFQHGILKAETFALLSSQALIVALNQICPFKKEIPPQNNNLNLNFGQLHGDQWNPSIVGVWGSGHATVSVSSISSRWRGRLGSVPGSSGSCVGVGEREGMLTVCPPSLAQRLHPPSFAIQICGATPSKPVPRVVLYMAACRVRGRSLSCSLRRRVTPKRRDFQHVCSPSSRRLSCWTVRELLAPCEGFSLHLSPSPSWLTQGPLSCPRDQNSATHPAHKPSSDVTDTIRMHIRTNI